MPAPVSPTKATVCPAGIRRRMPLSASSDAPSPVAPYAKSTSSKAISPRSESTSIGSSAAFVDVGSWSSSWMRPSETVACW